MPFGTQDVFPTLCGLAGLDVPEGLDGQDCSAAFVGGESVQDHVYLSMHHAFVPWPGWRGIRTERYNYARTEDGPWILFDVENDLFEKHNLVGENAELVAEMDTLLLKAMADCGDTWRGVDQKRGDWEGWLGPKQSSQGVGAVYPGSERFQGNDS
jgi:arylsulfatase A-like enzyme